MNKKQQKKVVPKESPHSKKWFVDKERRNNHISYWCAQFAMTKSDQSNMDLEGILSGKHIFESTHMP